MADQVQVWSHSPPSPIENEPVRPSLASTSDVLFATSAAKWESYDSTDTSGLANVITTVPKPARIKRGSQLHENYHDASCIAITPLPKDSSSRFLEHGFQDLEQQMPTPPQLQKFLRLGPEWELGRSHLLETSPSTAGAIATKHRLEKLRGAYPLPPKTCAKPLRNVRWILASTYRKLFALVFLSNLIVAAVMLARAIMYSTFTYKDAATAAAANLFVGVSMRNEHVVNLCFDLALLLPHSTPLWVRRKAAKVYSYGGIHSGCGVSAVMWYLMYTALAIINFHGTATEKNALATVLTFTTVLFFVLVGMAHPTIRQRWHNEWELSHRFGGWLAVGLVWAQTIVIAIAGARQADISLRKVLVQTPTFWFLIAITCLLIYPWLRLRSRKVVPEKISSHAVRLHFDHRSVKTCVGVRLTDAPLTETHAFASIPNPNSEKGYSVLISKAGDWTSDMINKPPTRIWVKGVPTLGVAKVALLFKKVIIVATGSGIGPCLSLLQAHPDYPLRVLWSAKRPGSTFGSSIIDAVRRADSEAVIIDTDVTGRPDMLALTYALYKQAEAEAIVIISNPTLTQKVVYGMESRGAPAYGAIFDS